MRLRQGTSVLVLPGGRLRIGVDPGLVVDAPDKATAAAIDRLAAGGAISERAPETATIRQRLAAADLIEPAPLPQASALLNDGGELGIAIGIALAANGWAVRIDDQRRAAGLVRGIVGAAPATLQAAAALRIGAAMPGATVGIGEGNADAAVLIGTGAMTIEASRRLMSSDLPHLYVVATERGITVGPLVLPGGGPCGGCIDLHHADADPTWPFARLQLGAPSPLPVAGTPRSRWAAAGLACLALEAWRAGAPAPWTHATWSVADGPPERSDVAAHPDCGCGAAAPFGDEVAARRARWTNGPVDAALGS